MVGLAPFLAIFGIKRVSKFRRRWTERKRAAVQSSWAALLSAHGNDRMSIGVLIFRKLFTHEEHGSHVLRLFPFRNQARTLFVSAHLKLHARLFVDTMTTLVANLHDLEKVERDLRSLGQRHLTYGVVLPEHFTLMGDALIATLDESDAVTLDKETRDAWIETWGFIAKEMQRGRGRNEIGIKEGNILIEVKSFLLHNNIINEFNKAQSSDVNKNNLTLFLSSLTSNRFHKITTSIDNKWFNENVSKEKVINDIGKLLDDSRVIAPKTLESINTSISIGV